MSLPPPPELARRHIYLNGYPVAIVLVKLYKVELAGQSGKNHYNFKSEFETMRDKVVDQFFGSQNDPMSRPPLDSTPLGTNMTNGTTSPSDLIPVRTKSPKPMPLTLLTYLPGEPDLDPSF